MRKNAVVEAASLVKHKDARKGKKSFKKNQASSSEGSTSNQAQSEGKTQRKIIHDVGIAAKKESTI